MKNIILCSADPLYFLNYGPALIKSAQSVGLEVIIDCINFQPKSKESILKYCLLEWANSINYNLSFMDSTIEIPKGEDKKIYYSCGRINALVRCMEQDKNNNSYFSLDIDSIILRYFRFPTDDNIGLSFYFRDPIQHGASNEWEIRGMKLLGTFFVTTKMLPYLKRVKLKIDNNSVKKWFIDQVSLYEAMIPSELSLAYDYSKDNILGWDIDNITASPVLTGKGQRKFLEKYINLQSNYHNEIMSELKNVKCGNF